MKEAKDLVILVAMAVLVFLGYVVYNSMDFVKAETKVPGGNTTSQQMFIK